MMLDCSEKRKDKEPFNLCRALGRKK